MAQLRTDLDAAVVLIKELEDRLGTAEGRLNSATNALGAANLQIMRLQQVYGTSCIIVFAPWSRRGDVRPMMQRLLRCDRHSIKSIEVLKAPDDSTAAGSQEATETAADVVRKDPRATFKVELVSQRLVTTAMQRSAWLHSKWSGCYKAMYVDWCCTPAELELRRSQQPLRDQLRDAGVRHRWTEQQQLEYALRPAAQQPMQWQLATEESVAAVISLVGSSGGRRANRNSRRGGGGGRGGRRYQAGRRSSSSEREADGTRRDDSYAAAATPGATGGHARAGAPAASGSAGTPVVGAAGNADGGAEGSGGVIGSAAGGAAGGAAGATGGATGAAASGTAAGDAAGAAGAAPYATAGGVAGGGTGGDSSGAAGTVAGGAADGATTGGADSAAAQADAPGGAAGAARGRSTSRRRRSAPRQQEHGQQQQQQQRQQPPQPGAGAAAAGAGAAADDPGAFGSPVNPHRDAAQLRDQRPAEESYPPAPPRGRDMSPADVAARAAAAVGSERGRSPLSKRDRNSPGTHGPYSKRSRSGPPAGSSQEVYGNSQDPFGLEAFLDSAAGREAAAALAATTAAAAAGRSGNPVSAGEASATCQV